MVEHLDSSRRRVIIALGVGSMFFTACSGSDSSVDPIAPLATPTTDASVFGDDVATNGSEPDSDADVPDDTEPLGEPVANGDGEAIEGAEDLGALGETPVQIDDGDEMIEIGIGDLPEALANGFPLPDDFAVDVRSEVGDALGVTGTTGLTVADATTFYTEGLAADGYTIVDSTIVPDVFATFEFDGPKGPGQIAVSETPGSAGSTIVITLD